MDNIKLKRYRPTELRDGMIVGRSIYDKNEVELLAEGTVLSDGLISFIQERNIYSVLVREVELQGAVREEHVLDVQFSQKYESSMENLRYLFDLARRNGQVDVASFQAIADSCYHDFTDGLKAITHVHNMKREGDYLLHHSVNVAILAGVLGRWLDLPPTEQRNLILAGLIHDIGKTQIDEAILNKPDKLTFEEMEIVKQHTKKGFELLKNTSIRERKDILFGVLQHHERLDRSGYPEQLAESRIYPFARILAIVDTYDAMAANRAYARKNSPLEIIDVLFKSLINQLDLQRCMVFIKNIRSAMNGNWVLLTNGEKAKIVYIDENHMQALPMVQTQQGKFYDLNKEKNIQIAELLSQSDISETTT